MDKIQIAVIGTYNAGKTTICDRFMGTKLRTSQDNNVEIRPKLHGIDFGNTFRSIYLVIHDYPGFHEFRNVTEWCNYTPDQIDAYMIVYSEVDETYPFVLTEYIIRHLNNEKSWQSRRSLFPEFIPPCVVVKTKIESRNQCKYIEQICTELRIPHFELQNPIHSSLPRSHIDNIFNTIVSNSGAVFEQIKKHIEQKGSTISKCSSYVDINDILDQIENGKLVMTPFKKLRRRMSQLFKKK